jgi:hypothetical protein
MFGWFFFREKGYSTIKEQIRYGLLTAMLQMFKDLRNVMPS